MQAGRREAVPYQGFALAGAPRLPQSRATTHRLLPHVAKAGDFRVDGLSFAAM